MDALLSDIRYAIKMLAKKPGFTAVAVIVLAVGIGANTAVFSMVDALLFRPLPFEDLNRLVMIWGTVPQGEARNSISPADFVDWKNQNTVFEHIAAYDWWNVSAYVPAQRAAKVDPMVALRYE